MGLGAVRVGAAALCATVAGVGVALLVQEPARAAEGAQVRFTELPPQFRAGAAPVNMTVVVSKRTDGDCLKVRWSMVIRADGFRLDQLQFDRVEETGSFPVDVQADGDVARLTDKQLDPGQLCRDRTVTARYRFRFDERVTDARVTFEAQALDANRRLLERATATRSVRGEVKAPPTTPPETVAPTATADPSAAPSGEAGGGAGAPPADDPPPAATGVSSNAGLGVPPVGFVVGALMVFLGLTLLLRLRKQLRRAPVRERERPAGWDDPAGRGYPRQGWNDRPRLRRG